MKSIQQKRKEAQQRAEARSKRSDKQQLALLDQYPGEAKRERARLEERIAALSTDKLDQKGEIAPEVKTETKKKRAKKKKKST